MKNDYYNSVMKKLFLFLTFGFINALAFAQCYNDNVSIADNFKKNGDYNNAITFYQKAINCGDPTMGRGEAAQNGIAYCNSKIAEQNAKANYDQYMEKANSYYSQCKYDDAIKQYNNAINSGYAAGKSTAVTAKAKAEDDKKQSALYLVKINAADESFSNDNYGNAISLYNEALNLNFACKNTTQINEKISKANQAQSIISDADSYIYKSQYKPAASEFVDLQKLNPKSTKASQGMKFCFAMYNADLNFDIASDKMCTDKSSAYKSCDSTIYYLRSVEYYGYENHVKQKITEYERLKASIKVIDEVNTGYLSYARSAKKRKDYESANSNYEKALKKINESNAKDYDCVQTLLEEINDENEYVKKIISKPGRKVLYGLTNLAEGIGDVFYGYGLHGGPEGGITNNWIHFKPNDNMPFYFYHPGLSLGGRLTFEEEESIFWLSTGAYINKTGQSSFVKIYNWDKEDTCIYEYDRIRFYTVSFPILAGVKFGDDEFAGTFAAGIQFNKNFGYKYLNKFTEFSDNNQAALVKNNKDLVFQIGLRSFDMNFLISLSYFYPLSNSFNQEYTLYNIPFELKPFDGRISKRHSIIASVAFMF